jgi:hypothetical protein
MFEFSEDSDFAQGGGGGGGGGGGILTGVAGGGGGPAGSGGGGGAPPRAIEIPRSRAVGLGGGGSIWRASRTKITAPSLTVP